MMQHVRRAGCASKIGQADLLRVLGRLSPTTNPNVLVGTAAGDDAGVYKLNEREALVQTVDVFTPCVDSPRLFGQIAAANSVSDVYAMGGRPITALSVIGFPIDELDGSIMEAMLRGAMEKLDEAECALIGGHSINDPEIKMGFAVTGLMDPAAVVQRDAARPGDALVLTKPLGTGMIVHAAQAGHAMPEELDEAGAWMARLNRDAAEQMMELGAHACTDITGFGLAGHLVQMTRRSGVDAEVDLSRLPVLSSARDCLRKELFSCAMPRNQAFAEAWVEVADSSHGENLPILYDPQTSGGLLIALPPDAAERLVSALRARGHAAAAIFGRITAKAEGRPEGRVIVVNTELGPAS